jgi:hypothetical protein
MTSETQNTLNMDNKTTSKRKTGSGKEIHTTPLPQGNLWPSYHAVAKHWKSDVQFFEDELNFFRLLIDKHLALLIEPGNIEQTRAIVTDITKLENERTKLDQAIDHHIQHIVLLVENPFAQNAQECKSEHEKLESSVASFVKKFRTVKMEVFKLTERIIHSEKAKRLIDWA